MEVIAYDPYCSRERAGQLGVTLYDTIEDVLPRADFITVHTPATDETIGMFGPEEFSQMKDGVILVNVAQGGIYDVKALSDFVAAGWRPVASMNGPNSLATIARFMNSSRPLSRRISVRSRVKRSIVPAHRSLNTWMRA